LFVNDTSRLGIHLDAGLVRIDVLFFYRGSTANDNYVIE